MNKKIKIWYHENMVPDTTKSYSKSPQKPKLLIEKIKKLGLDDNFEFESNFEPFENKDFYLAHYENYVESFFSGGKGCESNSISWTESFAKSVRYTNSSLYNAIRYSIDNPEQVQLSPISGVHHAGPTSGSGFCTFSGQVIASTKIFRELGLSGSYIDLDAHFGNSIEDSRTFVKDLNKSVPKDFGNINPKILQSDNQYYYIEDLKVKLDILKEKILQNKIHYLVFCHGADSHIDDNLSGKLSTENWLKCAEIFSDFVNEINKEREKPIPVTLTLFGGYRNGEDYEIVLNLHIKSIFIILNNFCKNDSKDNLIIK